MNKSRMRLGALTIAMSLSLTGCASFSLEDVRTRTDNLNQAFTDVKTRNEQMIDKLYSIGLLNESEMNDWKTALSDKCEAIMVKGKTAGEKNTLGFFLDAIVWRGKETMNAELDPKTQEVKNDYKMYNGFVGVLNTGNVAEKEDNAKPIQFFDESSISTFKTNLNRDVYVLNSAKISNGTLTKSDLAKLQMSLAILKQDTITLDRIMEVEGYGPQDRIGDKTLGEYRNNITSLPEGDLNKLETYINGYFIPAKDAEGNVIKLFDIDENDIFVTTKSKSSIRGNVIGGGDVKRSYYSNKMGTDICISSDNLTIMTIRIRELNPDLIGIITGKQSDEVNSQYYLCQSNTSSTVALQLDYPLYAINSIYTGTVNNHGQASDTDWECEVTATDLTMNMYTGQILGSSGITATENFFTTKSLTISPNTIEGEVGLAKYYNANGEQVTATLDTSTNTFVDSSGNAVTIARQKAQMNTLVLMDYLEYTYLPGVISGEKFIASGRRLRVSKLRGTTQDDIDYFAEALTKDGTSFETPIYISLKDICDWQSGTGYYEGVAEKLGLGDSNTSAVETELAKSADERSGKLLDIINAGLVADESLSLNMSCYFNWIRPVLVFGNNSTESDRQKIDVVDASKVEDGRVVKLYGMFTSLDIQQSGLYSSWITASESRSSGSLYWWMNWLKANKFGYEISVDAIINLLTGADTVRNKGSVIYFDLNTIAKIQNDFDNISTFNLERTVRTVSRLFGLALTSYGVMLLGFWVVDVNSQGGFRLLNKATFGKWVAVSVDDGWNDYDDESAKLMTFSKLIINVSFIIAFGVLLMIFDIVDIMNIVKNYSGMLFDALKSTFIN